MCISDSFNSMKGLNLFTSVANSGREIPAVKWLYGNADDTLFGNRFLTTVVAIRCLQAIKVKKIAIAGGVAEGFVNLEYDKKKVCLLYTSLEKEKCQCSVL